ncbi:MAG TPA: RNA polymerase sigma factor [Opitutales bacterium]|nr:RNA polymerase sigma factor [Opitutales bacterium]
MDPDLALIEAIQKADESALRTLMERYREPIFRFAWRYVRNDTIAAEIAEETFVKVFFKAHSFRPKAKVSTWIFSIAANLCHDHYRREARRKILPLFGFPGKTDGGNSTEMAARIPDRSSDTEQAILDRENEALVAAAVDRLPAKLKSAFILFALEGHSQRECAEILGISPKTVETRVYRARRHLREKLGDHFYGEK